MKRTPLKRKTPLRNKTPLRRLAALHQYRPRRGWQQIRQQVQFRADGFCEAQIDGVCARVGSHAHHVLPRSAGGQDELENLLWLCSFCHSHIHHNPAESYDRGWLRRRSA